VAAVSGATARSFASLERGGGMSDGLQKCREAAHRSGEAAPGVFSAGEL
jgi:hypothetical protein